MREKEREREKERVRFGVRKKEDGVENEKVSREPAISQLQFVHAGLTQSQLRNTWPWALLYSLISFPYPNQNHPSIIIIIIIIIHGQHVHIKR